jgi:hypothetical protein
MTMTTLDRKLVDAFTSGELDRPGEAALAEQVARLLPYHWTLPNSATSALSQLTKHLGGPEALDAWLDSYPGRPRVVVRTYRLIGLLDQITDRPAIATALVELRAQVGEPRGLEGYLRPDTSEGTLGNLAEQIELLLAGDTLEGALRLARSTADVLHRLLPRALELDPDLSDSGKDLEQIRHDLMATS